MNRLALVMLVLLPFCAVQAQTKAVVHFRITGTVVDDRTGDPIPSCHVTARPVVAARAQGQRGGPQDGGGFGGPRQDASDVETDAHGRFVLDVPQEGRYLLSASGRGFRQQTFEAHGTFSTAVVLTKLAPTHAVVFRATSDAGMSGEVTDEAGEPVRNAQLRMYAVGDPDRTAEEPRLQMRNATQTDDRGHYEFSGIAAGAYKLSVTARPWYTMQNPPAQTVNGAVVAQLDPSLDVVYPVTWYPGTDDEGSAEKIELKYGERRQADFRLNAISSAHLLVSVPAAQPRPATTDGKPQVFVQQRFPQIQKLTPDGGYEGVPINTRSTNGSQFDVSGLAPGTYRISQPGSGPDAPQSFSILHITAGGAVTEAGSAVPEILVAIKVDGDPSTSAGQVSLTDTATGRPVARNGGNMGPMQGRGGGGPGGGRNRGGGGDRPDGATIYVQPGTYEVTLQGRDSFMTGVTATGAQVTGRMVKITEGNPHLLVHVAGGMASIEGTAARQGKPSVGAMVVLVPATMGDPGSLLFERRAQTATDGTFQMTSVIPGQYILLVIEHGWDLKWRNVGALTPYLLKGEPLDLAAAAQAHPKVEAVTP